MLQPKRCGHRRAWGVALWGLLAVAGCAAPGHDRIKFSNLASGPTGAFVDGLVIGSDQPVEDRSVTGGSVITLPNLGFRRPQDEAVAFMSERPPISSKARWTPGPDTLEIRFPDQIEIPVTVWILTDDFDAGVLKAIDDLVVANMIFRKERMGVLLCPWRFKHVQNRVHAQQFLEFDNSMAQQLHDTIGFDARRLNVYYVHTVKVCEDGGPDCTQSSGNGQTVLVLDGAEKPKVIVLGECTVPGLLAHETGHVFSLKHTTIAEQAVAGWADEFGLANVMHPASDARRYFTEGQVYRCHFDNKSQINSYYKKRGDRPQYAVHEWLASPPALAGPSYPALNRRIWPDGTKPAN